MLPGQRLNPAQLGTHVSPSMTPKLQPGHIDGFRGTKLGNPHGPLSKDGQPRLDSDAYSVRHGSAISIRIMDHIVPPLPPADATQGADKSAKPEGAGWSLSA